MRIEHRAMWKSIGACAHFSMGKVLVFPLERLQGIVAFVCIAANIFRFLYTSYLLAKLVCQLEFHQYQSPYLSSINHHHRL